MFPAHLREAEGVEDAARVAWLWVGHAVALKDRVLHRDGLGEGLPRFTSQRAAEEQAYCKPDVTIAN